jgi:hypothetical protein
MIGGVGLYVAAGYLLWHYEAPWWVMLVAMAGYIVDVIGAQRRERLIGALANSLASIDRKPIHGFFRMIEHPLAVSVEEIERSRSIFAHIRDDVMSINSKLYQQETRRLSTP